MKLPGETVPNRRCSVKIRPDTRKPLSTKKRSTPTQPPRFQAAVTACTIRLVLAGQGFMCRPRTRSTARVRRRSRVRDRDMGAATIIRSLQMRALARHPIPWAVLAYVVLAILWASPASLSPADTVPDLGDPLHLAWTMAWDAHQLVRHP